MNGQHQPTPNGQMNGHPKPKQQKNRPTQTAASDAHLPTSGDPAAAASASSNPIPSNATQNGHGVHASQLNAIPMNGTANGPSKSSLKRAAKKAAAAAATTPPNQPSHTHTSDSTADSTTHVAQSNPAAPTPIVVSLTQAQILSKVTTATTNGTTAPATTSAAAAPITSAPNQSSTSQSSDAAASTSYVRLSSTILPLVPSMDCTRVLSTASTSASNSYVTLFLNWLRDVNSGSGGELHHTYVLELSSGLNQGRQAWQFLVGLAQRVEEFHSTLGSSSSSPASSNSIISLLAPFASTFTYLLTDPLQANLDTLKLHPQLQAFFDIGLVDVAIFDPTDPSAHIVHNAAATKEVARPSMELYLQNKSILLTTLDEHSAVFCLCNEQMGLAPPTATINKTKSAASAHQPSRWKFDAFRYEPTTAQLKDWRVQLKHTPGLAQPKVEWSAVSIDNIDTYYSTPEYNTILKQYLSQLSSKQLPEPSGFVPAIYVNSLPNRASTSSIPPLSNSPSFYTFTLPITACHLVGSLRSFLRGPFFLLLGEPGVSEFVTLFNQKPSVGVHKDGQEFQIPTALNLHAIQLYTQQLGGYVLTQTSRGSVVTPRGVSGAKFTGLGFPAVKSNEDEEDEEAPLMPLPNRTASPVKSVLKSSTSPPVDSPVTQPSDESNGESKPRKVQFVKLGWKELKAQKREQKRLAAELQTNKSTATQPTVRPIIPPPANVASTFRQLFEFHTPFDAASLLSLTFSTGTPLHPKSVASMLSLSHYELDVWNRLKSVFTLPVPHEKTKRSQSTAVLWPESAMEHDLFQAFARVWSYYFALPSDIYGPLSPSSNLDLAFEFGSFYCIRRRYRAAIGFYQRSLEWFGSHPITLYNIAQCYIKLHCYGSAKPYLQQALGLDQKYESAQQWLDWVETQIGTADDRTLNEPTESKAIEAAMDQPFFESLGEPSDEDAGESDSSQSSQQPQARKSIQEEARQMLMKVTLNEQTTTKETTIKPEVKKPVNHPKPTASNDSALVVTPTATETVTSNDEARRLAAIAKKQEMRKKEHERKLAKRQAREAEHMARLAAVEAQSPQTTTTLPVASAPTTVTKVAPVTLPTSNGRPLTKPLPSPATPSIQSFLQPITPGSTSWGEMEEDSDEELATAIKKVTSNKQQKQQQQVNGPNKTAQPTQRPATARPQPSHHTNGVVSNGSTSTGSVRPTSAAATSDRFARPNDLDSSSSKYVPPPKQHQPFQSMHKKSTHQQQ